MKFIISLLFATLLLGQQGQRITLVKCIEAGKLNMLGKYTETFTDNFYTLSVTETISHYEDYKTAQWKGSFYTDYNNMALDGNALKTLVNFKKYKLGNKLIYFENLFYNQSLSWEGRMKIVTEGTFSNDVFFYDCIRQD